MAITTLDPDNDVNTKPPALSIGNAFTVDSTADGGQSLRAEFPSETGTASLSEYYRDAGVVPSTRPSTVVSTLVAETLRVPYLHPPDVDLYEDGPGRGVTFTETPSLNGDPFYIRVPVAAVGGGNTGIVKYVWGTNIAFTANPGSSISIMTGIEYQGYFYQRSFLSDPYTYTDLDGLEYNYYQIARRPVSAPISLNDQVPTSGPISFSSLYGATGVVSQTITIPALDTDNITTERGVEPDGSQGALFGTGSVNYYPTGFVPNAVLKRVSFEIGFDAKITVTAAGGGVPVEVEGSAIDAIAGNGTLDMLSVKYPGWRIIGPSGGLVLESFAAGSSEATFGQPSPGGLVDLTPLYSATIATATVDDLTERGTYHLEFTAQVKRVRYVSWGDGTTVFNPAFIKWKTPAFDIKIETT